MSLGSLGLPRPAAGGSSAGTLGPTTCVRMFGWLCPSPRRDPAEPARSGHPPAGPPLRRRALPALPFLSMTPFPSTTPPASTCPTSAPLSFSACARPSCISLQLHRPSVLHGSRPQQVRGSALPRPLLSAVCRPLPAFSMHPHFPHVCPDLPSPLLLLPHLPPQPGGPARPVSLAPLAPRRRRLSLPCGPLFTPGLC